MAEEAKAKHIITVEGRKRADLTGVTDVLCFDEDCITADTADGAMTIRGRELHITTLDLEKGILMLDGEITEISYDHSAVKTSFFGKILK